MKKINYDTINEKIKHFRVNDEFKEKFLIINDCIKKNSCNCNINIIIDNMPIEDITKHINYIKRILKYNGIKSTFEKYDSFNTFKSYKNKVVQIDLDDELSYRIYESADLLSKVFVSGVTNNNILIITSVLPISKYDSFRKIDVDKKLPSISFRGEYNECEEYNKLIRKYKKYNIKCNIKRDDFALIVESIKDNNYVCNFSISDYLYDYSIKSHNLSEQIVDLKTFDGIINEKNKVKNDIDKLVGLENIKKELNNLFNYANFLKKHNISSDGTYLNMFFLGNPGTGKTMVANYIADKLYEMGYIKKNEIVKVIPTDLIGEYVGQTSRKIRAIFKQSEGKILFIDEAYLLYNKDGDNPFMQEAVVELLKYLEEPKNIVIFAGYKDKMMNIYKLNPGIKSRIYKEITFNDYNVDELYTILLNDLKDKGISIKDEKEVKDYINYIRNNESFGNARSMKQLSQKLIMNLVNRENKKDCLIVTKKDIPEYEIMSKMKMGFGE